MSFIQRVEDERAELLAHLIDEGVIRLRLATQPHPYYPDEWLSKGQALDRLHQHSIQFPNLTMALCRELGFEVSSTGHIRKISVDHYIVMRETEQERW